MKDCYLLTFGIKPSFSDMVKAWAKTLQNPVPIAFVRMMLLTLSIPGALPFLVQFVLCE